ncbi:hypothetical protein RchiOBHm_Chr1g0383871 [Rosa chinensis]|uniref:Transmembrane protein n=1 Tax=Rosa chinensis TaxID=74649 RepID=A0A2P6SPT7_ROSCH|nr:hypothetical protein RchiOBHm_Chr1g0383871 [Rosa chinensis]
MEDPIGEIRVRASRVSIQNWGFFICVLYFISFLFFSFPLFLSVKINKNKIKIKMGLGALEKAELGWGRGGVDCGNSETRGNRICAE